MSTTSNKRRRTEEASTTKEESLVLRSILANDDGFASSSSPSSSSSYTHDDGGGGQGQGLIDSFFANTWQVEPKVYRSRRSTTTSSSATAAGGAAEDPFDRAVGMGWDGVASLLQRSRSRFVDPDPAPTSAEPPLFFRDQTPIQPSELESLYNSNPFAAYLDGCSVVLNHADLLSPQLSTLCLDLQKSFPHAYVNTYLTPPGGQQAVPPHADDRDVFVIQLMGRKDWKVYGSVPILYPYPEEQVGKGELSVPTQVLLGGGPSGNNNGNDDNNDNDDKDNKMSNKNKPPLCVVSTTLNRGDTLYMPRGYVHEATTPSDEPSFHATVAIATHDWTLAGNISEMVSACLRGVPELRLAIDRSVGIESATEGEAEVRRQQQLNGLQYDIDCAMEMLKHKVTAESIAERLKVKYDRQNSLSDPTRMELIREEKEEEDRVVRAGQASASPSADIVGPAASALVHMGTTVRASTDEERSSVRFCPTAQTNGGGGGGEGEDEEGGREGETPDQPRRGLTVREETCQPLMSILASLKAARDRGAEESKLRGFKVSDLRSLIDVGEDDGGQDGGGGGDGGGAGGGMVCDLTLLSFVRCCVELGAMAVVPA